MSAERSKQHAVAIELTELSRYSIHQLRDRWRALFRTDTPPAFGPDLLRRSIAQKLQEDVFRKLAPRGQRELNQAVTLLAKKPARLDLPRRVKPGVVLVREWKGISHRVTVAESGFLYCDRTYTSLSEIAREITGTRWNGPRFFGLRGAEKPSSAELTSKAGR